MPELQKILHSMKQTIDNSANPPKNLIPNTGLQNELLVIIL